MADTQTATDSPLPDRLLSRRHIRELVPISDRGLYRWIEAGRFPRPIFVSGRNFWRASEITAWLEAQAPREAAAA